MNRARSSLGRCGRPAVSSSSRANAACFRSFSSRSDASVVASRPRASSADVACGDASRRFNDIQGNRRAPGSQACHSRLVGAPVSEPGRTRRSETETSAGWQQRRLLGIHLEARDLVTDLGRCASSHGRRRRWARVGAGLRRARRGMRRRFKVEFSDVLQAAGVRDRLPVRGPAKGGSGLAGTRIEKRRRPAHILKYRVGRARGSRPR